MTLDFSDYEQWNEAEGIKCFGTSFNKEARDKDRCSINESDKLNNLSAQELIELE